MATYTSKTLIPGQTPIGQNKDGSYIYEQHMSVASKKPKEVTPIYTPEVIPTVKIGGISTGVSQVEPKKNTPVKDVLKIAKRIDESSERTQQLREHFDYLKNNNQLFLNDKQTDYIKRVKTKYPDYKNVSDTILYAKLLLADPKVQEKYGNIGEKTFLQRFGKLLTSPVDVVKAGIEGVEAYKAYNIKDGGFMNEGTAIVSGVGKFVGDTFTNVGANWLNLIAPSKNKGTTSTSELLGKNVGEIAQEFGDIVASGIDYFKGEGWTDETMSLLAEKVMSDPETKREFDAAMNILNIIPGGFASQSSKALTAKATINNIREQVLQKSIIGKGTTEAFEAGINRPLSEALQTGIDKTNVWLKTLPPEKQKNIIGEAITPTGEAFVMETTPSKLMTARDKVFANKTEEELAFRAVSPRQTKATTPKQMTEIGQKNLESLEQLYSDARTGRITADIDTMGGGAEGIDEGLNYWGKKIGELTKGESTIQVSDITTALKSSLDDPKIKLNKDLSSLANTVVEVLDDPLYKDGISISELQTIISDIKGQIFSDKNKIIALTKETAGKKLATFLDQIGQRFDDAVESTTGDLAGLKEAKAAYSKYKRIQKDFLNSYLVQERGTKGGLSNIAGTAIGITELLKNPTPLGITKSLAIKMFLEQVGIAKSRGGSYEALIRAFDRKALTRKLPEYGTNNLPRNLSSVDNQVGVRPPQVDTAKPVNVTPVNPTEGISLANAYDNGVSMKDGSKKKMSIKEAVEDWEALSDIEKVKALEASPKLERDIDLYYASKNISERAGGIATNKEIEAEKTLLKQQIESGYFSREDLNFMAEQNADTKRIIKEVRNEMDNPGIKTGKPTETKELPKKIMDLEEEIIMMDENMGDKAIFLQKYYGNEYADTAYDAVKDMDRFEIEDYAQLWKDKPGGGMIPKNESSSLIIDYIDGFADSIGVTSDEAIEIIREGTGNSRYRQNLAEFKNKYGVAPHQAKKALAKFKKDWEAGKNPSIDDFLYKPGKTIDFTKPSREEMDIMNSKTPWDDDPDMPITKTEPTTNETPKEIVSTPEPVKETPEAAKKQETPTQVEGKTESEQFSAEPLKTIDKNIKIETDKNGDVIPESIVKKYRDLEKELSPLEDLYHKESEKYNNMLPKGSFKAPTHTQAEISKQNKIVEDLSKKYFSLKDQKEQLGFAADGGYLKNYDEAIKLIDEIQSLPTRGKEGKVSILKSELEKALKGQKNELDEYVSKYSEWFNNIKKQPLPLSSKQEVKYGKAIETLEQEAKKYKSAEEFIKAQKGINIFHGTKKGVPDISRKEFRLDNKDRPTPGISFSIDKKRASDYGDNVIEAKIKPNAKIIKLSDAIKEGEITQLDWNLRNSEDEAIRWAKENGYDGIDISDAKSDWYKREKEIRIFNKDAIYTKQQLIDIFNKTKS